MKDQNPSPLKLIREFYGDLPKKFPKVELQKQEESLCHVHNNKKKIKAFALSSSG